MESSFWADFQQMLGNKFWIYAVVKDDNQYVLRTKSLRELIKEIDEDMEQRIKELEQIAKNIDEKIGL